MKKTIKILSFVLVVVLSVAVLASCGLGEKKNNNGGGGNGRGNGSQSGSTLTPSAIKPLLDIPNYSSGKWASYSTIDYGDTSEQEEKLTTRIDDKKEEVDKGEDVSSVTKIFAYSEATEIIDRMSVSGLPKDKMISTVNYMAGEKSVTTEDIEILVESGVFNKRNTQGWSFFDDYDYYEKLQDRADRTKADVDKDNVKRQYRNMAGKVFAIGMTGAEFARVVTNELEYATEITESDKMANSQLSYAVTGDDTPYDTYCKENLDYETLVYLRAFNEYRNAGTTGFTDCVELYGYYYDYNKTSYESQTDEVFEKQLTYSHQTTYTDAEWWEYMTIQRNSYTGAYRYKYSFYQKYYNKHFSFQGVSEKQENFVYGLDPWQNKSYTAEMRLAVSNNNFEGQLAMSDWMWCYNGDQTTMNAYNKANTNYQNGKKQNIEKQKEGELYYDIEQLKMTHYLLTKMKTTELSQMLRFQVYSYSSEMIESAQGYNKDIVLIENLVNAPSDAINVIADLTESEERDYAIGKIEAILDQMVTQYGKAQVESNAQSASNQPWAKMAGEVQDAIDYDYINNVASGSGNKGVCEARVERLEDLVVKRKYSCGAAIDDDKCTKTPNNPHIECTKEYDLDHNISKFMNNYERIIRYMASQLQIEFDEHVLANANQANNYNITEVASKGNKVIRTAGYKGNLTADEVSPIEYKELNTITINSGKSFSEALALEDPTDVNDDKKWWNEDSSKPKKASSEVTISGSGSAEQRYTYNYTFAGWYLDPEYKYVFDVDDEIKCDLILYAGYNCEKVRNN